MNIKSFKPIATDYYFGEAESTRGRPYRFGVTTAGDFLWAQRGEFEQAPEGQRLWLCEVSPPASLVEAVRTRVREKCPLS